MFAYLEGVISFKSPSLLHLAVNGVGYEVHISLNSFSRIQHLDKCRLYTHLLVREDGWVLYGFADEQERNTFRLLLAINGVGAATARMILSYLTPAELDQAVHSENTQALTRVKGIGSKTAQRILLELKGKPISAGTGEVNAALKHNTIAEDALIALVNLGIARPAAEAALKKAGKEPDLSLEELIKHALRSL